MGKQVEENDLGIQIVDTNTGFIPENIDAASLFLEDGEKPDLNPDRNGEDGGDGNGDGDGEEGGRSANADEGGDGNAQVQVKSNPVDFKGSILRLANAGIIAAIDDDTELETDEEGTVLKFKDVDIQNEDDYMALVETLFAKKKEELLAGREDLSGVSDFTKKIIEIDKAGGDVSAVVGMKKKAIDPIQNLDLDNVDDQKIMLAHYLSLRYPNMSDDEIRDYVDLHESKGTLAQKAEDGKKELEKAFEQYAEKQKADAAEAQAKRVESEKKYRKDVKDGLGVFQLKEEYAKKVLDFTSKRNERGAYPIVEKCNEILKDPAQASELALFLYDRDEYIRQKTNKAVKETNRINFKRIAERGSKPGTQTQSGGSNAEEEMIDLGNEKLIIK